MPYKVSRTKNGDPVVNGRFVSEEEYEMMKGEGNQAILKMMIGSAMALGKGVQALGYESIASFSPRFKSLSATSGGEMLEELAEVSEMAERNPEQASVAAAPLIAIDLWGVGAAGRMAGGSVLNRAAQKSLRTKLDNIAEDVRPGSVDQIDRANKAAEAEALERALGVRMSGQAPEILNPAKVATASAETETSKVFKAINSLLGEPRAINQTQFDLINLGLLDEVGFQIPPAWQLGKEMFASINSNPILRRSFLDIIDANDARLGQLILDAVPGLRDATKGKITTGIVGQTKSLLNKRYAKITDKFDEGTADLSFFAKEIESWLTPSRKQVLKKGQKGDDAWAAIDNKELMRLRSDLTSKRAKLVKQQGGDPDSIDDFIENTLDPIIQKRLSKDMLDYWAETRELYRINLGFQSRGVFTPDGDLSVKSLANSMAKYFKELKELSPEELANKKFLRKETGDLVKYLKVANSFRDGLSDSGTATRTVLQSVSDNPMAVFTAMAFRKQIDETLGKDPKEWIKNQTIYLK